MLRAKLKKADFEKLEESVQALYTQDGDVYILQVDGLVPKERVDEFRNTNKELQTKLDEITDKYGNIDPEKYQQLVAEHEELTKKEMIEKGDVDQLIEQEVAKRLKPLQEELDTTKTELGGQVESNTKLAVDNKLTEIATKIGVAPTAIPDFIARGRGSFTVEGGIAVGISVAGGKTEKAYSAKNPNERLGLTEWADGMKESAPHLFTQSSGGGGKDTSNSGKPNNSEGMTSAQKISAGLEARNR